MILILRNFVTDIYVTIRDVSERKSEQSVLDNAVHTNIAEIPLHVLIGHSPVTRLELHHWWTIFESF
jgi:hypothetical protein